MDHRGQYQYGGKLNLKILCLCKNFGKERKMGLGNCETTFQIKKKVEYNIFLKVSRNNLRWDFTCKYMIKGNDVHSYHHPMFLIME